MSGTIEYRDVPGFEMYRVGNNGTVWRGERRLKERYDKDGYVAVALSRNGVVTYRRAHILVLAAFVGQALPGHVVRHLDGNPANNCLTNLRYGTRQENEADKKKHGTYRAGDKHPWSKLTSSDVLLIRKMRMRHRRTHGLLRFLSRWFNVVPGTIGAILAGKSWAEVDV